ncbi:hypothetical protein PLESTB_001520600 [Pleodorina starrii]|uniref:Metallo-beta-lactamase domain-containing protein n=1 Tax=Pleodorina starrii TaxID=330485 RepID=A0A9W6F8K5_9CHLO|nr:hypothetical protein PLESTM_001866600 [Pleodorina starrii]GLC59671.1 hypothetical protein PLESTB_001520600 [Pleodorina starrii]GLC74636.1 hypothetical protein PLESTF_001537900 [Pleodorina starrii]
MLQMYRTARHNGYGYGQTSANMYSCCRSRPGYRYSRRSGAVAVAAEMDWSHRRNERVPREENVAGSFFVDRTCIDCDTCRWMAPATFSRVGAQSAVVAQPTDRAGRVQALKALLSCPTNSIHATNRSVDELREAQNGLPARVPEMERDPLSMTTATAAAAAEPDCDDDCTAGPAEEGVYYTGWTAEASYAGCPYLIVRPGGNILVDSPRYNPVLARRIEALGGVKFMFLTHRDDVAGHESWAKHFGATRILHQLEVNEQQATDKVEIKLYGEGPWVLTRDGAVMPAAEAGEDEQQPYDVTFIFTPGHTTGHVCMYFAPYKALFSGDHLSSAWGTVEGATQDELFIFTRFNWYSVPEQLRSVAKLLQYDWLHVLPAHGRRAHLRDATARLAAVSNLLRNHGADGAAAAAAAAGAAAAAAANVTTAAAAAAVPAGAPAAAAAPPEAA